jgi:hypothetical protein
MKKKRNPIQKKEEIKNNPDHKIDQDYKGYPHGPAKEETIIPKTRKEKIIADLSNKDGEKINYQKNEIDEQQSDGSANAFEDK